MRAKCPYCAEESDLTRERCERCGERLDEVADVILSAEGAAPDAGFAARVRAWPDGALARALRDYSDLYGATQRRALLDELDRRGLPFPLPARRSGVAPMRLAAIVFVGCCLTSMAGLFLLLMIFDALF